MVPGSLLPTGESLKMAYHRMIPFWEDQICPTIMEGKNVLIVAHGNVLRGIIARLSGMTQDEILKFNIPTAVPFVYEFDKYFRPIRFYFVLGDDMDEEMIMQK